MNKEIKENIIEIILKLTAVVTILTTVGIIWVLLSESIEFFKEVSLKEFITDKEWTPLFANKHYGILPLVAGTLLTTVIAISVALPIGITIAIYLSEYAPKKVKKNHKTIIRSTCSSSYSSLRIFCFNGSYSFFTTNNS